MVENLVLVKDYKDNDDLRKSFNQLSKSVFGIEFETWYQHGYWTDKYQPYSFVDNGKVVANVSVNLIDLVINDEVKKAIQIGTVMTAPKYRNIGLSKMLMDKVLEDYKNVDLFYLFANQSVLEFYPKFGFETLAETQFSMDYKHIPAIQDRIRKLDASKQKDLEFIYKLAHQREPISRVFATMGSEELLMFYCLVVFPKDLYYLEDEQALVIYQTEGNILHLYDVVSMKNVNVNNVLKKIASEEISRIIFHFQPDMNELLCFNKQPYQSSNVLFVKNMSNVIFPIEFKHPITSQA